MLNIQRSSSERVVNSLTKTKCGNFIKIAATVTSCSLLSSPPAHSLVIDAPFAVNRPDCHSSGFFVHDYYIASFPSSDYLLRRHIRGTTLSASMKMASSGESFNNIVKKSGTKFDDDTRRSPLKTLCVATLEACQAITQSGLYITQSMSTKARTI